MHWLSILVQLAISLAILFMIAIWAGFQGEYMRYSTPLLKLFDGVMVVGVLTPLALTVISAGKLVASKTPLVGWGLWALIALAGTGLAFGALMTKEAIGPAQRDAMIAKRAEKLRAGGGAEACELVNLRAGESAAFPKCRTYLESLAPAARWEALKAFAWGPSIRTFTENSVETINIPPADQQWFLTEYFDRWLEEPVKADFSDLFEVSYFVSSMMQDKLFTPDTMRFVVSTIIPKIRAHFADHAARADATMPDRAATFREYLQKAEAAQ